MTTWPTGSKLYTNFMCFGFLGFSSSTVHLLYLPSGFNQQNHGLSPNCSAASAAILRHFRHLVFSHCTHVLPDVNSSWSFFSPSHKSFLLQLEAVGAWEGTRMPFLFLLGITTSLHCTATDLMLKIRKFVNQIQIETIKYKIVSYTAVSKNIAIFERLQNQAQKEVGESLFCSAYYPLTSTKRKIKPEKCKTKLL